MKYCYFVSIKIFKSFHISSKSQYCKSYWYLFLSLIYRNGLYCSLKGNFREASWLGILLNIHYSFYWLCIFIQNNNWTWTSLKNQMMLDVTKHLWIWNSKRNDRKKQLFRAKLMVPNKHGFCPNCWTRAKYAV
jgi:hypothetical protein